jgi:hypothetical protein
MKAFIERQLYQPAVVLPMVGLMQMMVSHDFNLSQVSLMVATRGARAACDHSRRLLHTAQCAASH